MTDFTQTIVAICEYEATLPERNAAWGKIETNAGAVECVKCDTAAVGKVREAYFEDTKAFNSRENCYHLAYEDMRRIALSLKRV